MGVDFLHSHGFNCLVDDALRFLIRRKLIMTMSWMVLCFCLCNFAMIWSDIVRMSLKNDVKTVRCDEDEVIDVYLIVLWYWAVKSTRRCPGRSGWIRSSG
jgi:hypothetical protein